MGEQKTKKISEEEALAEAEKTLELLKEKKADSTKPTNVQKKTVEKVSTKKTSKQKKAKIRSKKYQEKVQLVDKSKLYPIVEALELVKKTAYTKFNASVELHIRLSVDKKNKKEILRGLIQLPHFTGKEPKVGIVDEGLIEKIFKDKKADFDLLLAKPEMMVRLAKIARILGPQGKMPNPKSGTITPDPEKTLQEIKKGRIEYKTDPSGIIHLVIGKISDPTKNLQENYQTIVSILPLNKLQSVTICATMGPGVRVAI